MTCRTHPSDPGAGVCACCLRERLSALGVAPVEDEATESAAIGKREGQKPAPHDSCRGGRKSRALKFSLSSPMRGNQTPKKGELNAFVLKPSASNSCLLAQILRRRTKNKKKSQNISSVVEDMCPVRPRKPHEPPVNGRGMSPASNNETPSPSGKKVAAPQPQGTQTRQGPLTVSSFAMCLNPLVRQHHCPAQAALARELRATFNRRHGGGGGGAAAPNASSALVLNRSRKLADLGKVW